MSPDWPKSSTPRGGDGAPCPAEEGQRVRVAVQHA